MDASVRRTEAEFVQPTIGCWTWLYNRFRRTHRLSYVREIPLISRRTDPTEPDPFHVFAVRELESVLANLLLVREPSFSNRVFALNVIHPLIGIAHGIFVDRYRSVETDSLVLSVFKLLSDVTKTDTSEISFPHIFISTREIITNMRAILSQNIL